MEFFASLPRRTDAETLRSALTVASLPQWCASVDEVVDDRGDTGTITCVWGEFEVARQAIRGGVRFTLPSCPNAFAWTVTTGLPPDPDAVVVHATINRPDHDPDFVESLEEFVADWRHGLAAGLEPPPAP
ncbi:MAG: hypothetical protein H6906_12245 [Hyphomicrobiales bacterium]|nr:hypothetical protein [Hyphomicrobiales bacterium]